MPEPIEDYAVIGDRHTAALVEPARVGGLVVPATLRLAVVLQRAARRRVTTGDGCLRRRDPEAVPQRRYVDQSSVLETRWTTATGEVVVTDAMPSGDNRADVVRRVVGVRGTVRMVHDWVVRPDYGRVRPWVSRHQDEDGEPVITAVAGPDRLLLRGPRLPHPQSVHHRDTFEVGEGDDLTWVTTWAPSHHPLQTATDVHAAVSRSCDDERAWAARAPGDVPHPGLVARSLLTLRLLTHSRTGGIVAAPTTSLPEDFGGERNWDYRYCWLRDAALTLESLLAAGYAEESRAWRDWLLRAVAGDPADLQIMYAVDGGRRLPEVELDHLPGYADSRPVRIWNGAVDQRQTDVLGEVMIALDDARAAGVHETPESWALQCALVNDLAGHWEDPDHGLWEIRGPEQHFTHSRVMVWAAFDRAIRGAEAYGLEGPVEDWRRIREEVRRRVLAENVDAERGCFTQHSATTEVDASLLTIPLVGFLPGDDPLVLGTIRAVEEDLLRDGLLLRYRTSTGVDGLAGDEHPFLACSFWLVSAYAAAGRSDDARALFDRLCGLANDVGLLSEEYDAEHDRMAGNFPQAFSHLTLVQAALALRGWSSPARVTPTHARALQPVVTGCKRISCGVTQERERRVSGAACRGRRSPSWSPRCPGPGRIRRSGPCRCTPSAGGRDSTSGVASPSTSSAVSTTSPPSSSSTVPLAGASSAVTVAVRVAASRGTFTCVGEDVTVVTDSARLNGADRPTTSGLWSEARNTLSCQNSVAL